MSHVRRPHCSRTVEQTEVQVPSRAELFIGMVPILLCLGLTLLTAVHWASGEVTFDNETQLPIFKPTMSGFLDWGISAYAAAGQTLPAWSGASTKSGVRHDRWISYGRQ